VPDNIEYREKRARTASVRAAAAAASLSARGKGAVATVCKRRRAAILKR